MDNDRSQSSWPWPVRVACWSRRAASTSTAGRLIPVTRGTGDARSPPTLFPCFCSFLLLRKQGGGGGRHCRFSCRMHAANTSSLHLVIVWLCCRTLSWYGAGAPGTLEYLLAMRLFHCTVRRYPGDKESASALLRRHATIQSHHKQIDSWAVRSRPPHPATAGVYWNYGFITGISFQHP